MRAPRYSVVRTFPMRSTAQSISSPVMVNGGATRMTVSWVSLQRLQVDAKVLGATGIEPEE